MQLELPCYECKTDKPCSEFSKDRTKASGFRSQCKSCAIRYVLAYYEAHPERELYKSAKTRARRKGLSFTLELKHVVIPYKCPVLDIPLMRNVGKVRADSPTLDRVDNSKGYTPDNVRVISYRANSLKSDATVEEIEALGKYMRSENS